MKNKIMKKNAELYLLLTLSIATLASRSGFAEDLFPANNRDQEENQYQQINLVSDISAVAQLQDTNLVNAWGTGFGGTGPFWVANNGSGTATLYAVTNDPAGGPHVTKNARVVAIPGNGRVTGMLNNGTPGFNANAFIFVSEDGTISGWRGALGNNAEILATRNTAVYKGVTLATNGGPVLLVANFGEGTVDEYDSTARLIGQFIDHKAPAGYAPFNVQNVGGIVFVTFAKQNATKQDDDSGRGRGLIDILTPSTGTFHRFATGRAATGNIREMNSPWGVTLAPKSFGTHGGQLLVGNKGSGTIMAFEANGRFRGLLTGTEECPVTIDGLWALTFGAAGTAGVPTDLYFTAGPNSENHGLFGVIQPVSDSDNGDNHH